MKKIILSTGVMILSITCFAQNNSAGNVFIKSEMFPVTGKSFTIGSQKSVDKVLESFKAYNSKDFEKYISLSVLTDQEKAFQKNWFNSITKVEEKPFFVFPLRLEGTKEEVVFTIAEEDREYKNGSKQKLFVVELNKVNEEGKLTDFWQFKSIPANSEFGKTSGGKFLGRIQNAAFRILFFRLSFFHAQYLFGILAWETLLKCFQNHPLNLYNPILLILQ